jgi:competence protein ComEC
VRDRRAFADDCRRAIVIITRLPAPSTCRPPVLLDRAFFTAHGATAVRLTDRRPRHRHDTPPKRGPPLAAGRP